MNRHMTTRNSRISLRSLKREQELREFLLTKPMYDNFEFLQSRNIDPVIPVRKGAIDILKHPRSEEARKQKDFDRWKDEKE